MDFTTDKIQTLLNPSQGLKAVGLAKLEDLNIKQLQKIAEEVNKKYRIKGYKALTKAKLIEELQTRFPHLEGKEGKLEDLSLKAIQSLTVKYQNEFLIKNINKMNKGQLIEAIRRVAPHLEDTPDVRLATPEPSPEPEDEPEPDVVSTEPTDAEKVKKFKQEYKEFFHKGKKYVYNLDTNLVYTPSGKGVGVKTTTSIRFFEGDTTDKPEIRNIAMLIPTLARHLDDPDSTDEDEDETEDETEDEESDFDREEVEAREINFNESGEYKKAYIDKEGDIMDIDGNILTSKGNYRIDYKLIKKENRTKPEYYTQDPEEEIIFEKKPALINDMGFIFDMDGNILARPGEYFWDYYDKYYSFKRDIKKQLEKKKLEDPQVAIEKEKRLAELRKKELEEDQAFIDKLNRDFEITHGYRKSEEAEFKKRQLEQARKNALEDEPKIPKLLADIKKLLATYTFDLGGGYKLYYNARPYINDFMANEIARHLPEIRIYSVGIEGGGGWWIEHNSNIAKVNTMLKIMGNWKHKDWKRDFPSRLLEIFKDISDDPRDTYKAIVNAYNILVIDDNYNKYLQSVKELLDKYGYKGEGIGANTYHRRLIEDAYKLEDDILFAPRNKDEPSNIKLGTTTVEMPTLNIKGGGNIIGTYKNSEPELLLKLNDKYKVYHKEKSETEYEYVNGRRIKKGKKKIPAYYSYPLQELVDFLQKLS